MYDFSPEDQPDLVPVDLTGRYLLRATWHCIKSDIHTVIAAGYEYELHSIPNYLLAVHNLTLDGPQRGAFLLHNYLYAVCDAARSIHPASNRSVVDDNLRIMLLSAGLGRTRANHIHKIVCEFGWIYWGKHHLQYAGLNPKKTSLEELQKYTKFYNDNKQK